MGLSQTRLALDTGMPQSRIPENALKFWLVCILMSPRLMLLCCKQRLCSFSMT